MDSTKFDHLSRMMAQTASRRTAVQVVAALLAALGLGSFGVDEAEAKKSCSKKCRKKKTKKRRQRCRKRCRKRRRPECRNNSDCPAGELCEDGTCIDDPDQCETNNDCDDCERCDEGVCVTTCTADETCENDQCVCINPCGAACCGADETCVGSGESQTCCPTSDTCGGPEPEVMICCTGDETCVGVIPNQACRVDEVVDQDGSGTLVSQSDPDCGAVGSCTDLASGTLTGTPIAAGTFTGLLTGTNYQVDGDTFTADVTGTLTATETSTGDELSVNVTAVLTQNLSTGAFTTDGTYQITGGTGRFAGASGSGTTTSAGTDAGQAGTITSLTMDGDIVFG